MTRKKTPEEKLPRQELERQVRLYSNLFSERDQELRELKNAIDTIRRLVWPREDIHFVEDD